MRLLIAGGAGFLGSHLSSRYLAEGNEVICVDNLITGRRRHVEMQSQNPRFRYIEHNISEPLYIDEPIDAVLNFASPASPIDYLTYPIPTLKVGAIGSWHLLGLAKEKQAVYLLASTSEVYGDPQIHPQPETYWGHVNPVGPRGVYDEAKRYAEAITMAYHRFHGVDTRIVRIFNSILADEQVLLFNDDEVHLEAIGEYANRVALAPDVPRSVLVPSFDPGSLRVELRKASALIKHYATQDAYELRLRYGRSVKVTGDHSVFVRGEGGLPAAKPVREIGVGDHVAIPAVLPCVERDLVKVDLVDEFARLGGQELWRWKVRHASFATDIETHRKALKRLLLDTGRNRERSNAASTISRWKQRHMMPLAAVKMLGLETPRGAEIAPYTGGNRWLPAEIELTDDLLWLAGFFIAEGSGHSGNGVHFVSFSSDLGYLQRAKEILESIFNVRTGIQPPTKDRAPQLWAHSRVLYELLVRVLKLREKRFPAWIMQLPLSRLKFVLEGFRCGDGTHSGKKVGNELAFDTASEQLALDLNYILMRFGVVASFGRYETTFKQRYGDRRFPFFRLTVCEVDSFDILSWDRGVAQRLNARRDGDIVWSKVREIRPCVVTGHVYDFSVPQTENFVAGSGVYCHNTFGPSMRREDGRAVTTFIVQALEGKPMTVHGDGSQTRSFCYVDDLIEGIVRLLGSAHHDPVNIGNPEEFTVLELAEMIKELSGSPSEIVFEPRPVDDPSVRKPDITKAREILGWEPKVPVREGLARTIEWFRTDKRGD